MSGEKFVRKSDGTIFFQAHKDNESYGEWLMKNNRPEPKLKPYGWGIVDKDGKPYFAHDCIAQHSEDLSKTIEYLNEPEGDEDHRAPWKVVPIFYKEEE